MGRGVSRRRGIKILREDFTTAHSHKVLVHACFQPRTPVALGSGRNKIFHRQINSRCSCARFVDFHERDSMLERGECLVVCHENSNGHLVPDWRQVVRMFAPAQDGFRATVLAGPPMARTIGKSEILDLVEGEANAQAFVASYYLLEIEQFKKWVVPFHETRA